MSCHYRWYMFLLHWIIQSSIHISCPWLVNSRPDLHITLLVITGALIARTVTQRAMICHHWWYLCLLHWMVQSLIHLSCPRFVNSHPALHITQHTSCNIIQDLLGLHLRHINHAFINIAASAIVGRRWHGIWKIRWSPTGYWRSLQLMRCVIWRSGWLLTNREQLSWINDWIIPWRKHRYHRWWQLIALWVTVIAIKALFITIIVMWRPGLLLTNRGQMRCIDDWIIQWKRNRYHR